VLRRDIAIRIRGMNGKGGDERVKINRPMGLSWTFGFCSSRESLLVKHPPLFLQSCQVAGLFSKAHHSWVPSYRYQVRFRQKNNREFWTRTGSSAEIESGRLKIRSQNGVNCCESSLRKFISNLSSQQLMVTLTGMRGGRRDAGT
jgi:hypothetical protein